MQEECNALDNRLKDQSAAAESAKLDHQRQHLDLQTQTQTLQQQLKDLRSEHQQLQEKHDSLQSMSASISHVSQTAGRPSMLSGVKAMLQKLNGSQQQPNQLPISVPSLVLGHHVGVDTPPPSAHTTLTSAFRHGPQGILQQPQGHSHVVEGASRPVPCDAPTAGVAEPSGQQEDEWDIMLRCARGRIMNTESVTWQHMQTYITVVTAVVLLFNCSALRYKAACVKCQGRATISIFHPVIITKAK